MSVQAQPSASAQPAPGRAPVRLRRLGLWGRLALWLCGPWFRRIALDRAPLAGLSAPIVYVLRAFSRLERLYVEWALRTRLMPPGQVVWLRPRTRELEELALARPETSIVPLAFIWGRPPVRPAHAGEDDEPPTIRLLRRGSSVKVAAPLLAQAFLAEHGAERAEVRARRLRWELSGRLERERMVVLGPPRKTARRMMREILRSRRLSGDVKAIAPKEGLEIRRVFERAARYLREIAADIRPWMLQLIQPLLRLIWNRIYDGIDVDQAGIAKVREAARRGSLILCPSHKSHVDYLVLSYVFYRQGLVVPHVAAGANLSFWPLGYIFRRCGAFFLRRTFKGNPLYAAVFRAYVHKLVDERVPIEFFIEGGRSRTGKLLAPKLGLLGMVCEAARARSGRAPQVVPISILYERVIEEKSYADELGGGEKKPEDVRGLLGAGGVLLARYGRVDIQFDQPFDLNEALGGVDPGDDRAMRAAVRRVSHRIVYGIARATAITPSALWASALLAPGTRGVARADAERSIALLEARARRAGARFTEPFERDRAAALERALELLVAAKHVTRKDDLLLLAEERRPPLDYYKNNALNWFVAEALLARALLALAERAEGGRAAREALRSRTLELSRLLKLEFVYRVGASFEVIFEETLAGLVEAGFIKHEGDAVLVGPGGGAPLELLGGLCENFIESYWAVASALGAAAERPIGRKELERAALQAAERMYLRGEIKRREAVARTTLANALDYFKDTRVLTEEQGKLRLSAPEAAATLADGVRWFLG
ncbi:MAG TPA: 1-acyl-sn-glycerol-3-phosphate acyltransferase [Polyangia bacterium]|nr:1-acyl-sn-glycerol-3-phosphate acyltransferase [Polyangia bacterium]